LNRRSTLQYAPHPPFDCGDPSVAEATVLYRGSTSARPEVEATARAIEKFLDKKCV